MKENKLICQVCGRNLRRAIMKHNGKDFDIYCSQECEELEKEYDSGVLKIDEDSIENILSVHSGAVFGLLTERGKAVELFNVIKDDIDRLDTKISEERKSVSKLEKLKKLIEKRKENALKA